MLVLCQSRMKRKINMVYLSFLLKNVRVHMLVYTSQYCFLLQDMSQEVPSEELVAKDLRGSLWPFRHIYRGIDHFLSYIATKKYQIIKFKTYLYPNSQDK